MRHIAVAAALLTVTGCNQNQAANNLATANTSAAVVPDKPAAAPAPVDPQLARRLDEVVREEAALLPAQVDQMTTHASIRREGAEIVHGMTVSGSLPISVDQIRPRLEAQQRTTLCAMPEVAELVRAGASFRYEYTLPDGTTFQTRMPSCS